MELRLIPVVAFAAASLLAVKVATIVQFDGRLPFAAAFPQANAGGPGDPYDVEITGSTGAARKTEESRETKATKAAGAAQPAGEADKSSNALEAKDKVYEGAPSVEPKIIPGAASPAERALLARLGERRKELDARTRDIEMRENLLKDAEARLQSRINELKEIENRINGKGGEELARLKNIVVMYEGMKPKDAARIFEKLDQSVLVDVAVAMKPRKLSDVLAQMDPDAAQRLTVELAKRSTGGDQGLPSTDLKKIDAPSGS